MFTDYAALVLEGVRGYYKDTPTWSKHAQTHTDGRSAGCLLSPKSLLGMRPVTEYSGKTNLFPLSSSHLFMLFFFHSLFSYLLFLCFWAFHLLVNIYCGRLGRALSLSAFCLYG